VTPGAADGVQRERGLHLGLATTLPPAPTGPAEFVAGALPELARATTITCFVENPAAVDPWLRERFAVRALAERNDPAIDLLVYHIANNLHQVAIYDAAMDGPPGLLEIHDGSLHHTLATRMLSSDDVEAYRRLMARTHGPRGDQLAGLRLGGQPAGVELFMFDGLKDLLDRHLGAVVHNHYAADLMSLRAPELPTWVVPLSAPVPAPTAPKASLGLPADKLVIAHFGFVTRPKRPFLLLEAFARLRGAGHDAHLLFAGEDDTAGELSAGIKRLGLEGHVTVTGYLAREEMDALISSVDVVVSLRFPHVGETSATLGAALAAGRPVVVQETGSWAELPEEAVLRVPTTGDEVAELAAALGRLAADAGLRASLGAAASAYATGSLGAERYARGVADAALAVALGSRIPPSRQLADRRATVAEFLTGGHDRLTTSTLLTGAWPRSANPAGSGTGLEGHLRALADLPPSRPGDHLLDMGGTKALLRLLECIWGYEVTGATPAGGPGGVAPAGALPYDCAAFDVVTCWDLLPAARPEAAGLLAEINRVLRPSGLLVLTSTRFGDLALRQILADAGLAPDAVTVVESAGGSGAIAAVARKVGLPALSVDVGSSGPR
jgi:glycosyltransferase involved in cell wall biosynthesis